MGTRPKRCKPKPPLGDPNDSHGFGVWAVRYLEALGVKGYSERTAENQSVTSACSSHGARRGASRGRTR